MERAFNQRMLGSALYFMAVSSIALAQSRGKFFNVHYLSQRFSNSFQYHANRASIHQYSSKIELHFLVFQISLIRPQSHVTDVHPAVGPLVRQSVHPALLLRPRKFLSRILLPRYCYFNYSFMNSFIHSFTYSFIHSYIHSFVYALIESLTHMLIDSFSDSFINSFIDSLIL